MKNKLLLIISLFVIIMSSFTLANSNYTIIDINDGFNYTVFVYNSNDTFTLSSNKTVQVLAVAGGGGGGGSQSFQVTGGGGGAGGLIYNSSYTLENGSYTVVVGSGGVNGSATTAARGSNGTNSSFGVLVAMGGGGGGGYSAGNYNGSAGGSGGGGTHPYNIGGLGVSGQGNRGGNGSAESVANRSSGSGGGAGSMGSNGTSITAPVGGVGLNYSINGSNVYYAGGGGAALCTQTNYCLVGNGGNGGGGNSASNLTKGTNGTPNTGGGGGSSLYWLAGNPIGGGSGGSGIVIVRYLTPVLPYTIIDINDGLNYTVYQYTSGSVFTINENKTLQVLVVAGGGGGAGANTPTTDNAVAGGGAGGLIFNSTYSLAAGNYNVIVGSGGAGGPAGSNFGTNGMNSSFDTLIAVGGGGGGKQSNMGLNGGSGGGGANNNQAGGNGTTGQGYKGGTGGNGATFFNSGGGGGSASVGMNAGSVAFTPDGGNGTYLIINGTNVSYAGGGGGGCYNNYSLYGNYGFGKAGGGNGGICGIGIGAAGSNATANTGGGGGGASPKAAATFAGGNGGSGIVIVRYLTGGSIAPVITNVSISPLTAYYNTTLIGFCNASGSNLNYSYIWYKNGVNVSSGFSVNNNVANFTGFVHFDNITLSCNVTDTTTNLSSIYTNSSTLTISNYIPIVTNSTILPVTAYANDTLYGYCNATDASNDTISYNYTWYLNDVVNISGQTNITNLTKGQNWVLQCTANDSYNTSSLNSSIRTISNSIPIMVSANITPLIAYSNTTLGGVCVGTDIDVGDTLQYYWNWYNNTVIQNSGLGSTIINETSYHPVDSVWSLSCIAIDDGVLPSNNTYQENASEAYLFADAIDPIGYIELNYTWLVGATNAIWLVKHGNTTAVPYNVSIPLDCNNINNKLQLRFWSSYDGWSAGECYNGTNWKLVTLNVTGGGGGGTSTSDGGVHAYDGDWATWSNPCSIVGAWCSGSQVDGGMIFEEAIYWQGSSIATPMYSNNITIDDLPPVTYNARISPNLSYINTTLNGYCNVSHFDNTSFNISYGWYKNNTITCYQETANISTSCGGLSTGSYFVDTASLVADGYFYINYTKPVNILGATWLVKHGIIPAYNITLTGACYAQSPLKLRIKSDGGVELSQPQCYNGTSWENIGLLESGTGTAAPGGTSGQQTALMDGNWITGGSHYTIGSSLWIRWHAPGFIDQNISSQILEEAMYWSINNITSVTNGTYINGTNYGETNVNNLTLSNSDYGYDYYLTCNAYDDFDSGNTVFSTAQRVNDLITYSSGTDDSTSIFPQIGDVINLNINITNRDYTNACRLAINDTGTWRYPVGYISTILVDATNIADYVLPFAFYVTNASVFSNNNISWRVECNDTHNTTFISNVSMFTVQDVTYPTINVTSNSFNINTSNTSIISGYFYNLTYNITYTDPNLFAMEVNVTCNKNGTIYYFTNVSLNPLQSYNMYDKIVLNNVSVQNCTFFTAVSDSHTAIETPVYLSERLSNGISYLTENKNLIQITSETEETIQSSLSSIGKCIKANPTGPIIIGGGGEGKCIVFPPTTNTFTNIETKKLIDRETFKFDYDDYSTIRQFIVRADKPIYYIEESKYPAHFVIWDAENFRGNWLDFNDLVNSNQYTVVKINDYEYIVNVESSEPINTLQFSSIGGTLITNFSFTFYIGGTIFLNTNNTVNGSTFINYSYVLQNLDSYPGINTSGTVPSNNASIQNISEGNYTLYLTHSCYFPQTTTVNVNNLSLNISYNSYQSERTIQFKHVVTLVGLTNVTYNITGLNTDIDGNTGNISSVTLHLNAGIYNITWSLPGYLNMTQNITTTCLENTTTNLYTSFVATFNLFDERLSSTTGSDVVFNISGATSVAFSLFCPGETISTIINTTNFTTIITCPYIKFKFLLTYGTTSYYRTFIIEPDATNGYPIYLIDQLTTSYLFNSLVADDLLNKYIRPRIYVLKTIGNRTVQISADFADIEQKIGAYLIENHEYIIQILSDNLPIYTIGNYAADLSGSKNIRLYQVSLYDPASGGNETIVGNFFVLNTTQENSTIRYRYQDDKGNTTSTLFKVYQNNTLLCSLPTLNSNNFISDCPMVGYNRSVVRVEVIQTVDGVTTTWSRILHDITTIGLPIVQYFGQSQVNWFLIIVISSLALFGAIQTANIYMVGLLGIAILFNVFGWLTISTSVLAFAAMVALIAIFKEGDKSS